MVLRPTFESTPPFTIRPNYPSGNPFHPSSSLTSPRCFTTANYTYLRPRVEPCRDWILVNSLLFRLYDGRNKGSRGRVFRRPSPISLGSLSSARLIDPQHRGAATRRSDRTPGIDASHRAPPKNPLLSFETTESAEEYIQLLGNGRITIPSRTTPLSYKIQFFPLSVDSQK